MQAILIFPRSFRRLDVATAERDGPPARDVVVLANLNQSSADGATLIHIYAVRAIVC
jgi:hypothetical protein